jgi:hypothetical protein
VSAEYDRVVAALPRLTPDERDRVSARLAALRGLAPGAIAPVAGADAPDDWVADALLDAIVGVVLLRHGERVAPAALRRTAAHSAFRAKAGGLAGFAARHAHDRAARRALLGVGVDLLYLDLRRAGMTVTARTLMACVHQVPAVLDKAFPGYARSGLLGMVVGRGSPDPEREDQQEDQDATG